MIFSLVVLHFHAKWPFPEINSSPPHSTHLHLRLGEEAVNSKMWLPPCSLRGKTLINFLKMPSIWTSDLDCCPLRTETKDRIHPKGNKDLDLICTTYIQSSLSSLGSFTTFHLGYDGHFPQTRRWSSFCARGWRIHSSTGMISTTDSF